MTTGFQFPISSESLTLGNAPAAIMSHEVLGARLKPDTAEKYFGGVVPVSQYNREISRWMDRATTIRLCADSISLRELHYADSVFAHGARMMDKIDIIDEKLAPPLTWPTSSHHAYFRRQGYAENVSDPVSVRRPAAKLDPVSRWSDSGAKPFFFVERARRLLSKQRIREARDILQLGTASYPEEEKIASLLRAISPGQVRRSQGPTPSRGQEMDWLQEHGHRFRGQWVAVKGNCLVASASTLDKLIAELKQLGYVHLAPVIQKVAPE